MIDIPSIVQTSDRYNLHGHTQFCDGHADMEQFVVHAVDARFTHYGFTPHGPTSVPSTCNMTREAVPQFLSEVDRLRQVYGTRITLLAGMEIDYIDGFGPSDPYFQSLPLDYRIGSVHFIPSLADPGCYVDIDGRYERFSEKMRQHFDGDIEWVVRTFFRQMTRMVEQGGFDIVGHLDKIGHNASQYRHGIDHEPWYDALVRDLIEAVLDHHLVIEVNTKAWAEHGRFFPAERYFGMLRAAHAQVVFNSDAHWPHLINAGRNEAMRAFIER